MQADSERQIQPGPNNPVGSEPGFRLRRAAETLDDPIADPRGAWYPFAFMAERKIDPQTRVESHV